jgi:hypothetical protein
MHLTYGRCDRCRPTAVAQRVPTTGLVDTHQVDESGPAAGETSPPVKWAECRSCGCPVSKIEPLCRCDLKAEVARLGQLLVLAHDELERVISGETCWCSECAPYRAAIAAQPSSEPSP